MQISEMIENLKEQLNKFGAGYVSQNIITDDGYSFTCSLTKLEEVIDVKSSRNE